MEQTTGLQFIPYSPLYTPQLTRTPSSQLLDLLIQLQPITYLHPTHPDLNNPRHTPLPTSIAFITEMTGSLLLRILQYPDPNYVILQHRLLDHRARDEDIQKSKIAALWLSRLFASKNNEF